MICFKRQLSTTMLSSDFARHWWRVLRRPMSRIFHTWITTWILCLISWTQVVTRRLFIVITQLMQRLLILKRLRSTKSLQMSIQDIKFMWYLQQPMQPEIYTKGKKTKEVMTTLVLTYFLQERVDMIGKNRWWDYCMTQRKTRPTTYPRFCIQ